MDIQVPERLVYDNITLPVNSIVYLVALEPPAVQAQSSRGFSPPQNSVITDTSSAEIRNQIPQQQSGIYLSSPTPRIFVPLAHQHRFPSPNLANRVDATARNLMTQPSQFQLTSEQSRFPLSSVVPAQLSLSVFGVGENVADTTAALSQQSHQYSSSASTVPNLPRALNQSAFQSTLAPQQPLYSPARTPSLTPALGSSDLGDSVQSTPVITITYEIILVY